MVEASGNIESDLPIPGCHIINRLKGCTGDPEGPIEETGKDGVISWSQAKGISIPREMPFTRLLQHVQVLSRVEGGKILFIRFDCGKEFDRRKVEEMIGLDEIVGQLESGDSKGMDRAIIIIEVSIRVDEGVVHLEIRNSNVEIFTLLSILAKKCRFFTFQTDCNPPNEKQLKAT
jgi:hypothetical protein